MNRILEHDFNNVIFDQETDGENYNMKVNALHLETIEDFCRHNSYSSEVENVEINPQSLEAICKELIQCRKHFENMRVVPLHIKKLQDNTDLKLQVNRK